MGTKPSRPATLLVVLAWLAAACAGRDTGLAPTPTAVAPSASAAGVTSAPKAGQIPAGGGAKATAKPGGGQGSSGGGSGGGSGQAASLADDDGDVGDNALAYLRTDAPKLVVEVDAVQDMEPTGGAMSHLRAVLSSVLSKPAGIDIRPAQTITGGRSTYDVKDVVALERANRQTKSGADAASLYVLFVDGRYARDDPDPSKGRTLAFAYSASAFVVFTAQVKRAVPPLGSREAIEKAVFVHEAGHLLRLVNIGYRSPHPHEDAEHPHHSNNQDSVMYWAVESDVIASILGLNPPNNFDADDRDDLDGLKMGRLRVET